MITVHITDDHKMVAEGFQKSINESGVATVIGVSHNLRDCRKTLAFRVPDVLLLDLVLPDGDGVDFCTEIRKKYPEIKILILTGHDECSLAKRVIDNGASGYILKNTSLEEMIAGIETVMAGELFFCDEIDTLMKKEANKTFWLTESEKKVIRCIAKGYTNKETSNELCLSLNTITSYRKNIKHKLGPGFIKIAIEKNLL